MAMELWALTDLCTPWCVHVAATLRVADYVAAGVSDIDGLAAASGTNRDSLWRVLRHLVGRGVFEEPEPGRFALNDTARGLLEEGMRLALGLDGIGGRMAHAWGTLLSAVRTGKPAYHERFGMGFWEDLAAHPAVAASFDALMGPAGHGAPDPEILGEAGQWESVRTVVDVGGGTGAMLVAVVRAHPGVRGVLVDLPATVARAAEELRAAGVEGRVTMVGQSFFDPLPSGGDVYLLKNVLVDWPDAEAVAILRRCAEAARPSGRVVVLTNTGPGEEAGPELLMMVLVGGRSRSVEELGEMGRAAGLRIRNVTRQQSGRVVVEFNGEPQESSRGGPGQ